MRGPFLQSQGTKGEANSHSFIAHRTIRSGREGVLGPSDPFLNLPVAKSESIKNVLPNICLWKRTPAPYFLCTALGGGAANSLTVMRSPALGRRFGSYSGSMLISSYISRRNVFYISNVCQLSTTVRCNFFVCRSRCTPILHSATEGHWAPNIKCAKGIV